MQKVLDTIFFIPLRSHKKITRTDKSETILTQNKQQTN